MLAANDADYQALVVGSSLGKVQAILINTVSNSQKVICSTNISRQAKLGQSSSHI